MMSKEQIMMNIVRLNVELSKPDISMWRELEAKGELKALKRVLNND